MCVYVCVYRYITRRIATIAIMVNKKYIFIYIYIHVYIHTQIHLESYIMQSRTSPAGPLAWSELNPPLAGLLRFSVPDVAPESRGRRLLMGALLTSRPNHDCQHPFEVIFRYLIL